jgi:hypothetical protein
MSPDMEGLLAVDSNVAPGVEKINYRGVNPRVRDPFF